MDVLVDLTPLDMTSRLRGIGHYVSALGVALKALSPADRQGLDIQGLNALEGRDAVGPLDWEGRDPLPYPHEREMNYIWDRRLRLPLTLLRMRPRPRLLHVTQSLGTPRGTFLPRVITCHDLIRLVLHKQYLKATDAYVRAYRLAELSRYALARRVIAVSRFTADDLVRVLRVPASRIDVVPHGVDTERFHPPRSEHESGLYAARRRTLQVDQKPYFVYVGSTDPRKRADLLVRAFCRARIPDVELLFAAWLNPAQQRAIEDVWREEGSPPSVRFLGFVPDDALAPLLHGALALAYPSTYEGFGMPVLEAMAAGCPVITTSATSLGEVAGDAARLVRPHDLESLQQALVEVARDQTLRTQLRAAGLARAAQFTWRSTALGHVDTYVRALR